jgi:uncharacterized membrane protein YhaH (DUF805 family)
MINLLLAPHKKLLNFSGRAKRSEFWLFQLQHILIIWFLVFGSGLTELPLSPEYNWFSLPTSINEGIYSIASIIILYLFIPAFSVISRRLHDTNRSFFWAILFIVPIGNIILLVFLCLRGTHGNNVYGADPTF